MSRISQKRKRSDSDSNSEEEKNISWSPDDEMERVREYSLSENDQTLGEISSEQYPKSKTRRLIRDIDEYLLDKYDPILDYNSDACRRAKYYNEQIRILQKLTTGLTVSLLNMSEEIRRQTEMAKKIELAKEKKVLQEVIDEYYQQTQEYRTQRATSITECRNHVLGTESSSFGRGVVARGNHDMVLDKVLRKIPQLYTMFVIIPIVSNRKNI